LDSSSPLRQRFCVKAALTILGVFALAVGAAQAATKSDKRKSHNAEQNAAGKNATSNSKARRNSNKASGGSSGPAIERYDPVGKD